MKQMPLIFCTLLGLLLVSGCGGSKKSPTVPTDDAGILPTELIKSQDFIDQNQPRKARKILTRWIKTHKNHHAMDEALFLKAQADLDLNRDYRAAKSYDKLVKNHSASIHYTDALERQVIIAQRFLNGQKRRVLGIFWATAKSDALEILDKVVQHWPGSPLAAKALMLQADFFYREERFVEAQTTYQVVLDNYKTSPQFRRALSQSAEATFAQFNGIRYDSTPLFESKIRYGQARLNLPENSSILAIDQRLEEIENLLAQKELEIADYYHRTGQHRQARLYWDYIVTRWPGDPMAQKAKQLLNGVE